MQHFLGDEESRKLNLEHCCLALAIAKKALDENCFRNAQKTTARKPPSFQLGDRVYFKTKQPGKWHLKWRPRYRIVCIEHDGHYLHVENKAIRKTRSCNVKDIIHEPQIEFWNIDTQFGRGGKFINHPMNHLLGYYLCLNTCWKTLEVLKTKKYYYFHMTSFRWLPY